MPRQECTVHNNVQGVRKSGETRYEIQWTEEEVENLCRNGEAKRTRKKISVNGNSNTFHFLSRIGIIIILMYNSNAVACFDEEEEEKKATKC